MRADRDVMGWLTRSGASRPRRSSARGASLARMRRPLEERAKTRARERRAELESGICAAFATSLDAARAALRQAAREPRTLAARGVIGSRVFDAAGRKLGRITDLSIDKETGRIVYALIGVEGALGMLKRIQPAPWRMLRYDAKRMGFVAPADKADIEGAPPLSAEQLRTLGLTEMGWEELVARSYNPYLAGPFV